MRFLTKSAKPNLFRHLLPPPGQRPVVDRLVVDLLAAIKLEDSKNTMDTIQSLMDWAKTVLEQTGFGPAALPLAFVLGLASAVGSACCTLPLIGAIAGYSGLARTRIAGQSCWLLFLLCWAPSWP